MKSTPMSPSALNRHAAATPRVLAAVLLAIAALAVGCAEETSDPVEVERGDFTKVEVDGKVDASAEALFLDFEFDAQVVVSSSWGPERKIEDQLLYTIGQLNGDNSVARIDKLELSELETGDDPNGDGTLVTYHATMLVAWGDKENVPSEYELILPRDVSYDGQEAFTDAYGEECVDYGAHDVTPNSMWYYYRPKRSRCDLAEEDIVRVTAESSISEVNTTGKYPEYDKVWEDDVLKIVAVNGKYEDGATSNSDAGIASYNELIRLMNRRFADFDVTTTPAEIPSSPGIEVPEVVYDVTLPDGRRVEMVVILVDNVRTAGAEFDARYAELSSEADLITYMGHSGLGANIRALAQKGEWIQGQYAIIFMNGCDTYAYVDSALNDAHAAVNPDDPEGTKYLDLVMNALPSYFSNMAESTDAFVAGLMAYDEPRTFEKIFADISSSQVVLVSGEQDNEFVPGGGGDSGAVENWEGLTSSDSVARSQEVAFETPTLAPGSYVFEMTGTQDADLYVRVGLAPTAREYDCRPFKVGSNEVCRVELSGPAPIHVMVRGWADQSDFELTGRLE